MNYLSRQQKLQSLMREQDIKGYLVTQNVDLYYLTGTMQTGYLFIPFEGEARLYVRRSLLRAQEEAAYTAVSLDSFRNFGTKLTEDFPKVFDSSESVHIAAEFDVLPVQIYQRLQKILPQANWIDGSTLLREVRMIKEHDEIVKIKEAAKVVDIALEHALSELKAGMSELELISIIEQSLRLQGHLGIMRMRGYNQEIITGMVASGAAAAKPTYFDGPAGGQGLSAASPQGAGRKIIQRNEAILIDIGCNIDGYVIDQTRTAVIGELPEDLQRAYHTAETILKHTEARLKPGIMCEKLYIDAMNEVKEAGLSEHFMGFGADQVKFLGHGIGLEIDEFPILAKGFTYPLEPGMVIAIEPKFTFPDRGVVGIENTYVITETGYEKLTISREGLIVK
jgi:Xaa-Pro dipeptidase